MKKNRGSVLIKKTFLKIILFAIISLSLFSFKCMSPEASDGGKIVFASTKDDPQYEIYTMNIDGSNVERITYNPLKNDYYPSFSPDGTKIVYSSTSLGIALKIIDISGGNKIDLFNLKDGYYNFYPTFSSDGKRIIFQSSSFTSPKFQIYIINSDGTNLKRLTNNSDDDRTPSFSPDGLKIVYAKIQGSDCKIYIMNSDGSNNHRLTNNSEKEGSPSFSPDGTKIVYVKEIGGIYKIFIINSDGTNQKQLTDNTLGDDTPSFSPDGSKIVFSKLVGVDNQIFTMNIDGSNIKQLTFSNRNLWPTFAGKPR